MNIIAGEGRGREVRLLKYGHISGLSASASASIGWSRVPSLEIKFKYYDKPVFSCDQGKP